MCLSVLPSIPQYPSHGPTSSLKIIEMERSAACFYKFCHFSLLGHGNNITELKVENINW